MKEYDKIVVDLSNKELTCLGCNTVSSFLLAKEINLSNNQLISLDNCYFWQNVEKINLSGNELSDLNGLKNLCKLAEIDLSNNSKLHWRILLFNF